MPGECREDEFTVLVLDVKRRLLGRGRARACASGTGCLYPSTDRIASGPHILLFDDNAEWSVELGAPDGDGDGGMAIQGHDPLRPPPPFRD